MKRRHFSDAYTVESTTKLTRAKQRFERLIYWRIINRSSNGFIPPSWRCGSSPINNRFRRKYSTHNSVAEFSCDLYLVENGKSPHKRDPGEDDLIESWDTEHPIASEVIPLVVGSDGFSDKL